MITECSNCKKQIYKKPYAIKNFKRHFCSIKCQSEGRTERVKINCVNCGKITHKKLSDKKRAKNSFCSHSCANTYTNKKIRRNYKDGSGSYRARALREFGKFCGNKDCQIKKLGIDIDEIMLDVDHKNSDRSNNELDNLQVLCVMCLVS